MHRSIDSFRAVRLSTNVPAPCCTFSNPMLAKIFTASRTVERPTPKIFINSDSVGNFPPTLRDLLLQPDGHLFGQRSFSNRRIRTLYHHII